MVESEGGRAIEGSDVAAANGSPRVPGSLLISVASTVYAVEHVVDANAPQFASRAAASPLSACASSVISVFSAGAVVVTTCAAPGGTAGAATGKPGRATP